MGLIFKRVSDPILVLGSEGEVLKGEAACFGLRCLIADSWWEWGGLTSDLLSCIDLGVE